MIYYYDDYIQFKYFLITNSSVSNYDKKQRMRLAKTDLSFYLHATSQLAKDILGQYVRKKSHHFPPPPHTPRSTNSHVKWQ